MKNLFYLLLFTFFAQMVSAQKNCCPEFKLYADMEPCMPRSIKNHNAGGGMPIDYPNNPNNPPKSDTIGACKFTTHSYYIIPNKPGYTYTWMVTGGTLAATSGNPIKIKWGGGVLGMITVYIKSNDGLCKDTIKTLVKLLNGPKAGFNFTPTSPVCLNQNINFNNTSMGAASYYWDFGDGTTSIQTHPNHTYTTPGTYTITMVAYSDTLTLKQQGATPCGCRDTVRQTITVRSESGLTIEPGCKQMLCKGDTATYCTLNNCSSMSWSVTGGTIIGATNGKCIKVVWNGSYPATVTLNGNCGGACGNSTTINVPVLYPTMTPAGANKVCINSTTNYSLPAMPGTFYNWTVTGPNTIVGPNQNIADINVQWGNTPGTYTIQCDYKNPHTGCEGKATMTVDVVVPFKITGPNDFCVGTNFNFSANGNATWSISPATGYTPSSFSAGSTINGTWNTPGTYTVTATTTTPNSFCTTTDQIEIVVKDKPALNPITGPVCICPGGKAIYQASSNMGDGYFLWNVTGGIISSYSGAQNNSAMITWNSSGPYNIQITQVVNGCQSDPVSLTVNACPAPLFTGFLNTCMDEVVTYTSSTSAPVGGYNWTLSNGLGTILNGQGTNTVQILWHGSTGSNTCVLTLTTCGGSYNQTVTITNPPPLTITKAGSLCSSSGMTLTASISGATSYQWALDNVPLSQNTQSINITQAGTYTLTVVNSGGCKSKASIIVPKETLNVTATLSTPDKTYWGCNETVNTLLHAAPSSSAYCYQWYKSSMPNGIGLPISGATTSNYLVNSVGYYYCTISICNTSCKANTDTIKITKIPCGDTCTGITNYTVNFTNSLCNPMNFTASTTPTAALGWVHWYFGDGSEGGGITTTHQYKDTGTYMVCAVFNNTGYCQKEICKPVTVTIAANFTATANCDKVTFVNLSKAKNPITSYNWSFPGGTPSSSNLATPPVVTYATGGLQTVTLTVSDGICTTTYQDTIRTYSAAATMNVPTPLCAKTDAPFTATSTTPGLNYQWNFGDGFISNLQNVTHAYQNAGNYTVTLVVTSPAGCTQTYTQNVTVNPEPIVSIGTNHSICPGTSVTLTASSSYGSYQWYHNGVPISGATSSSYAASNIGEYWVQVANGPGCQAVSNHIFVTFLISPIAKIMGSKIVCTNSIPFTVQNSVNTINYQYQWNITGPASGIIGTPTSYFTSVNIPSKTPGNYEITLIVTDKNTGCKAYDTLCVFVDQSPTITVTGTTGTLCEGKTYTFVASATPSISPQNYIFSWSNGFIGDTLVTGRPGMLMVTVMSPNGCTAMKYVGNIMPKPNVSLFPVGCDTLCLTDTVYFPLPTPLPTGSYTVTWYDDDGTAVANVGTGLMLPLSSLQPGMHHLYATVSISGGCADSTGRYYLYIKDCTLPPPCDNCSTLLDSGSAVPVTINVSGSNSSVVNYNISFTIKKPVKEIRISLADLKYSWKDSSCANCKLQVLERGCLFPGSGNTNIGGLVWNDYTGSGSLSSTSVNNCPSELVWKAGSMLMPGTYTIPVQLTLPKPATKNCVLQLDKVCFHLSLVDSSCKTCETIICGSTTIPPVGPDCKCNVSDSWTNLNLIPQQPGIPKPKNPILCNTMLTGISANTNYVLSGVYYCQGSCLSSKNEVVVFDQNNQIIYTNTTSSVNETISFPAAGTYTIILTANCGTKKCACSFKVIVGGGGGGVNPPGGGNPPGGYPPIPPGGYPPGNYPPDGPPIGIPTPPDLPIKIDSIIRATIPPDFNGGILVAKNDSTLFEKYYSYKDKVNSHTAFDIASITKTFTSAAILKLMEEGKLSIDDAVVKYLPKFPFPDITIRMLLTHRSGLKDYLNFIDDIGWDKSKMVSNNDLLNIIADNKSTMLVQKPGVSYSYSNTNYALLAIIIETVSGKTYSNYLDTQFFMPLKMEDTYVLNINNFAKATKSYYKNGSTYSLRYLDLIYGDKCVYSTPQDLKKWDAALRSGKVLKKATMDMAFQTIGTALAFNSTYAIGWKKIVTASGKEILYHTGWWAGNRALVIRLLDEKVVIAVVSNNNFTNIKEIIKLCNLFGDYGISGRKVTNF